MDDLLILLINLDGSDERLAAADTQLVAAGLDYQRIAAFDARNADLTGFPEYDQTQARMFFGRALNGGELGCFFSHLNCLKLFLQSPARHVLIVEDDLVLDPQFAAILKRSITFLSAKDTAPWDALNFGPPVREKYRTPVCSIKLGSGNTDLCRAALFPLNTHCILWSRQGAEAFLDNFETIWQPVDHAMRHLIVRRRTGYCMSKAAATQSDAPSDIDRTAGPEHRGHGESAWYRFNVWRIKRVERFFAGYYRSRLNRATAPRQAGDK